MKARPILFSAPMVQALLDGRKTQTRRIVKPRPVSCCDRVIFDPAIGWRFRRDSNRNCPYGVPGDLLWVRETWAVDLPVDRARAIHEDVMSAGDGVYYRAYEVAPETLRWRPSIHMPRWASRLTLRITDVRVERVQDISEEDARAEGCEPWFPSYDIYPGCLDEYQKRGGSFRNGFRTLWNSINGPDAWARNDWVWCVSFDVIQQNVDEVLENKP